MRNRVLYLNPTKTARALDHLARDAMRLKRFFTDRVKFASDYISYRRQGKTHKDAVTNARNVV